MWDVIEHVNFPIQTLDEAMSRLESGGVLLLDTPARNGFFHRTGVSLYRLSGGRISGPLGMLYSDYRFAHKQIFHPDELRRYAEDRGYRVEVQELFHEISRPYASYLRTYLGSERLARALAPAVSAAIRTARFANKILFAVRKTDRAGSSLRPGLPGTS